MAKGTLRRQHDPPPGRSAPSEQVGRPQVAPKEPTSYDLPFRLLASGDRLKAMESEMLIDYKSEVAPRSWTWTFDGKERRTLAGPGVNSFPEGARSNSLTDLDANSLELMPVLMALRPTSPAAGPMQKLIKNMVVVPGMSHISGRPCLYVRENSASGLLGHLWVDVERDCVPMRFTQMYKGKTGAQIDFLEYRKVDLNWIPWRWKATVFGKEGEIIQSSEANVRAFAANAIIGEAEFAVDFPAGTLVTDELEKREYLILDDKTERPVTIRDFVGRTYEDLMNESRRTRWWRVAATVFVGICCLFLGIRLWRRGTLRRDV